MSTTLTGNFKKAENWKGSLVDFLQVGDSVCDEIVNHFINVLPPASYSSVLIQIGEPYTHVNNEAVYPTLSKIDGQWVYAGNCFIGDYVNQY